MMMMMMRTVIRMGLLSGGRVEAPSANNATGCRTATMSRCPLDHDEDDDYDDDYDDDDSLVIIML